jgi:hypothetical protein
VKTRMDGWVGLVGINQCWVVLFYLYEEPPVPMNLELSRFRLTHINEKNSDSGSGCCSKT